MLLKILTVTNIHNNPSPFYSSIPLSPLKKSDGSYPPLRGSGTALQRLRIATAAIVKLWPLLFSGLTGGYINFRYYNTFLKNSFISFHELASAAGLYLMGILNFLLFSSEAGLVNAWVALG